MGKSERAPSPRKSADPEEYKRFLETAKAVEASEDPKDFERAFKRTVSRPRPPGKREILHKTLYGHEYVLRFIGGAFIFNVHGEVSPSDANRIERYINSIEKIAV